MIVKRTEPEPGPKPVGQIQKGSEPGPFWRAGPPRACRALVRGDRKVGDPCRVIMDYAALMP